MRPVHAIALLLAGVGSLAGFQSNTGSPTSVDDYKVTDENREANQRSTDLIAELKVSHGDWVADIGAGGGYYSMRLSELAGPDGKVFAEDVSSSTRIWLRNRFNAFRLTNVEIVMGEEDDPKLPQGRLAGVLIVDTYHHFTNPKAMLDKIFQALAPGGRMVIADYISTERRSLPRADQLEKHQINPRLVRAEVEDAGFRVTKVTDPFVKWTPGAGNYKVAGTDMWLMVAVRPK